MEEVRAKYISICPAGRVDGRPRRSLTATSELLPTAFKKKAKSITILVALRRCLLGLYAQTVFAITPADVLSRSYDYLIVGGGLAGLTLGNRLTEDSHKQVLVLEAGEAHLDDPLVDIPGFLGATLGNASYDWLFTTVPQAHANNNSFAWSRGKMLGGSTGISFMAFTRPAENEIDGA